MVGSVSAGNSSDDDDGDARRSGSQKGDGEMGFSSKKHRKPYAGGKNSHMKRQETVACVTRLFDCLQLSLLTDGIIDCGKARINFFY